MKMLFISAYFVTFIANAWIYCNGADCSEGWISYESSCYYFSPDRLTWDQAFNQCTALQSHLVEIESSEENTFLATVLKASTHRNRSCSYYIGLTDKEVEGQWKWVTSKTLVGISHWYPGEPNNHENRDEDCVCFWRAEPGSWNDITCSSSNLYICERAKTTDDTDTNKATVPVYVLAVVVSGLLLLIAVELVFIIRIKRQSNISTAEMNTTAEESNLENDIEDGYNLPSNMSENSNYLTVISGNDILEREYGYVRGRLPQILKKTVEEAADLIAFNNILPRHLLEEK
ncbi:perlucin-like protein isoform X2 [Mercenaria mercenaria]|uniref:perlucin-like protein isoform X2 n=1 Tax=Mercenaria mercenaria TaxID=6596 RepID=UPI00234E7F36|nr:perlucin-like protein isoform X2 [Mercenaria mercenaria]